jgi:DNA-binding beta-propeller fold protein YncE
MIRSFQSICLLVAISLAAGVIWPGFALAVQAPQLELLGEVKAGLRVPARIATDVNGNLFVADSRLQVIFKFDRFGQEIQVVDQEKVSAAGLAVSPAGDRIYAAAFDKVVVFDAAGELLGYLGVGAGEFTAAGSITLDSEGTIYVADLGTGFVKLYHPDGSSAGQFGTVTFVANSALSINPANDYLYLPDSAVHSRGGLKPQLRVFDQNATSQQVLLAANGFGSKALMFFGGMAFDSLGRFYVSDVEGKTIRVLDENAGWLTTYDHNGQLSRPSDLAYDALTNRLFVIQADHRIDIYGIDGATNPVAVNSPPETPVPVAPVAGSEVASALPVLQFNNAIDTDDGDELSYTVRVFDAAGQLVTSTTVAEQVQVSCATVDIQLQENQLYRWQVQAFDGEAESAWSELQSFYVNAVQEAPSEPVLLGPLAAAASQTDALFTWQPAIDADPFDTVRYRFEVAADETFTELIYTEELVATERQLADWSELIEPGQLYHWRITAIDNHGLRSLSVADGRFLYQATWLQVAATMPSGKVYLGGNHGYAGQFIGETPCQIRDLPEGQYQLVIERAGFEPYYQVVELHLDAATSVYAELRGARLPTKLNFKPLKVAGKQVKTGAMLTPLLADLDLDGIEDLLLAHADGSLHFHPGYLAKHKQNDQPKKARHVKFAAETSLFLPQLTGGTPVVVDWNNDYLQDLLIGTADGSVWLLLNEGDFTFTQEPRWLAAVGSAAVPAVGDIDDDGDKDLLVGSGDGELVLFANLMTGGQPDLAEGQLLVSFADAAAPSFVDWNGDGKRELLIAAEGQIYHTVYSAGAMTDMHLLEVQVPHLARVFAHDLSAVNGKELLVGTTHGKLLLGKPQNNRRAYVADYYLAVEQKLEQLQVVVAEEAAELSTRLQPMFSSLENQQIERLAKQVKAIAAELPAGSVAAELAGELEKVLLH